LTASAGTNAEGGPYRASNPAAERSFSETIAADGATRQSIASAGSFQRIVFSSAGL
jgi:hypothetical protein